jgi:N-acetylglucosaminyl-diphospho-decaprenol L-rhamnosyltransferase
MAGGRTVSELDLAVVVVNWNVRDLLIGCLESARSAMDAAGLTGAIWVVDNASHDGSVEMLSARFTGVQLIASPVNLGFGGGNNLALRAMGFASVPVPDAVEVSGAQVTVRGAQFPIRNLRPLPHYVLLLNPDTLVRKGALREMVRFMERNARVGVCGPRLVYGDGRFQHSAYRFPSLAQTWLDFWPINWRLTESSLNGRYGRRLYEGGEPFPIDHPLGAAMLFRRETIQQTGGFDLDYHMYVEEIDLCMRVKRAGWEIYCLPKVEIVHYEGQSTRQVRPQMIVALWRSRYTLFGKYYSPLYQWVVRCIVRAGMRAKVRRARAALERKEMDEPTAQALIDAYRQVIEM